MHIILFTSSTNKSGGTRQALYLAEGLAERGHTVTFFIPEESPLPSLAPNFAHFSFLKKNESWRKRIESAMPQDGSPCVVHAFHNKAVKYVAWWGLFWRKKAAVIAHRGVLFRPNNPLPYWLPSITIFAVNSKKCAHVLHSLGLSYKRLRVVPNAVPDERITPSKTREAVREELHLTKDNFLFGTVANNNPVKGVEQALQAFAKYVHKKERFAHARYVVIGINPEQWLPLCTELGIQDKVILIPPSEEIACYLSAMDAFILPSLSESMPNTLLEAIRMHLPSIGTKVGAVPQILDSCGLCIDPDDVASLGNAMVRFLSDPALLKRLTAQAIIESGKYAPNVRLDTIEGIYTEALRKKGLTP